MVKDLGEGYLCEECETVYGEIVWAVRCEVWCMEHRSCNLDINKHAMLHPRQISQS